MKRIVARFFAAVIGLAFGMSNLQADPCGCPKRMIRGQTVDLQPLMNWWREPKGVRPLSSWKHLNGFIIRDTPYGWVIQVRGEGDGQAESILLKTPPRDRLRRFQELKKELAEHQNASSVGTALISRPIYNDWYGDYLTSWAGSSQSLAEYRQTGATLSVIHHRIAAISEELAPWQDASGEFKVDVFALKCADQSFEGMSVYDYGSTSPYEN